MSGVSISVKQQEELKEKLFQAGIQSAEWFEPRTVSPEFRTKYREYLRKAQHGILGYLAQYRAKVNPGKILPGVQSGLAIAVPYFSREFARMRRASKFKVASYAVGKDYHNVLKKKLSRITREVFPDIPTGDYRVITDSTPFPERYFARLAGLGFIGKNSMLIDRKNGSYFFLAFILFKFPLEKATEKATPVTLTRVKEDIQSLCGSCHRCVDACPTHALPGDGSLLVNRCISTITIEDREAVLQYPADSRKHRWVFGCDVCQMVCPYNREPLYTTLSEFQPGEVAQSVMSGELQHLSDTDLYGTPFKRVGLAGLRRNVRMVEN